MSGFDFSDVYAGLKDFQRDTVDYVFQRFYEDSPPTHRFLVADEVGLGKTLIARGVIARAAEHLDRQSVERIDVVYICSNSEIARQNIRRLSMPGFENSAFSTRLTLLPLASKGLNLGRLNFVAFTPSTALDLKNHMGWWQERALLYLLLRERWPHLVGNKKGPLRVFQGGVQKLSGFERLVNRTRRDYVEIDPELRDNFFRTVNAHDRYQTSTGNPGIEERFEELTRTWAYDRSRDRDELHARNVFVGDLRNLLAKSCVEALEPDLVILDEFQRFRHLLDDGSEASELAHALFNYSSDERAARVLLLSATPYKMYTVRGESEEDDHYADFLRTTEFLLNGDSDELSTDLTKFGRELSHLDPNNLEPLMETKTRVEATLRRVMCRTERLASGPDRNGMLYEVPNDYHDVSAAEILQYVALDRAAAHLGANHPIDYWKSAPYFPNYWDGYQIGRLFERMAEDDQPAADEIIRGLGQARALLSWDDIRKYEKIDPANSSLRRLSADFLDKGAWQLLWLPPAAPYYDPGGPFAQGDLQSMTKRLVFSSWNVVPRVVSTLLSYEAERRMMKASRRSNLENSREGRARFTEPIRFPVNTLTMSAFAFIYPSPSLARLGDPLEFVIQDSAAPLKDLLRTVGTRISEALDQQVGRIRRSSSGPVDERWYWVAALLLDSASPGQDDWLNQSDLASVWAGPEARTGAGFESHLKTARQTHQQILDGTLELGHQPDDLIEVLALQAVARPANCAFRAINRLLGAKPAPELLAASRNSAARIAWAFRSLFNTPEVTQMIRGVNRSGPYWKRALTYCADGNLQAVLDEYLFTLRDFEGIVRSPTPEDIETITENAADVIALRSSDQTVHDHLDPDRPNPSMRVRFALPFGQYRSEDESTVRRSGFVRTAFNSPFWPFVLATTSVGQEGLDFHLYCHAVVHWNLPSNPVDLEQREGRVHRYMGHAVRKNLAAAHRNALLSDGHPWANLVDAAVQARGDSDNDMTPFWLYQGPNKIERHVPRLPLSREDTRLPDLRRSVVLYRLVFGQARQQELLDHVMTRADTTEDLVEAVSKRLTVDLVPPSTTG